MKLVCILLLLVLTLAAQAQYDPAKVSKKASQLYAKALDAARDDRFRDGIQLLEQAIAADNNFEDGYLSMAGMYGELKDYRHAIVNYEKAKAIDSFYFEDYNLPYSINLAGEGSFAKALTAVNVFLKIPNLNETSRKAGEYRRGCYSFALENLKNKNQTDYKFEPHNLGDSINTAVSEYYPTVTLDGSKLIFTRRVKNYNEDFYESNKLNDHWSLARGLPGNINTNLNEGAQNISQDGQMANLYRLQFSRRVWKLRSIYFLFHQ